FADFDAELPWQTQALVALSDGLRDGFWWIVLGLVAAAVLTRRALQTETGRARGERVLLRLPVAGPLYRKALTASFCRTLATLLGGAVPLTDALGVTAEATTSPLARDAALALRRRVTAGGTLSDRLGASRGPVSSGLASGARDSTDSSLLFPPMVAQLVEVGEETARLDEMLAHAAGHYEREVDGAVDALASVIEPVLVVALGLVVGAILVAIYLPMFDLVTTIE
ncbi:MAG: type II secretion system F family protein, partial [Bacteroidota bacterium]